MIGTILLYAVMIQAFLLGVGVDLCVYPSKEGNTHRGAGHQRVAPTKNFLKLSYELRILTIIIIH